MEVMTLIKMEKKIEELQKKLEKKISEIDAFKSSVEQMIEQRQRLLVIRQEKFEENIKNVLKKELDTIHAGHGEISDKVDDHKENLEDIERMVRDLKILSMSNKQKIQILAEELEEILNDMNKKMREKDMQIEELRKHVGLSKKREKKEKIVEEIQILKKIEQRLSAKKSEEEEGLLEKIHFPFVSSENVEGGEPLYDKYVKIIERAEKKDDYPIEIAHVIREFIQKLFGIKNEPTYSELLNELKNTKMNQEVKKQLMAFFDDIVRREYANEDVKFPKRSELSSWAKEMIKVLEEERKQENSDKRKKTKLEKTKNKMKSIKNGRE